MKPIKFMKDWGKAFLEVAKDILSFVKNTPTKIPEAINKIIHAKKIKKEAFLMNEYKAERIIQVDNDKDNKQYLLGLEAQ